MQKEKIMAKKKVLLSWIARNNDPYMRKQRKITEFFTNQDGNHVWGPTLRLLFDKQSPYFADISDVMLLYRTPTINVDKEKELAKQTIDEVKEQSKNFGFNMKIYSKEWVGNDPTDHASIFQFLRSEIPKIRKQFNNQELIIHVSPGTPSMHTIWILMAETGFIEEPFKVVKSYKKGEEKNKLSIVEATIGIDSFYSVYKKSQSRFSFPEEQSLFWDPADFKSEKLNNVYREARRFARLKIPILILGERGTGKTTLANWIRTYSPYRKKELDQSWASVACGQFSSEMMRAELCGYEKGAFTGATKSHEGLLIKANKDTLFLDEIGDITKDIQRLLIRAIEEGTFYPLGSDKQRKSNFRLLVATNLPTPRLLEILDADFYDRISVFTLKLPPLREIKDDIPWLWEKVWNEAKKRSGLKMQFSLLKTQHQSIIKKLQSHPLQGNLRDLFQVAYRLIAICEDENNTDENPIKYALKVLENNNTCSKNLFREVISNIHNDKPLETIITSNTIFSAKELIKDFKEYLGNALNNTLKAERKEKKEEKLYGVTKKTITNWINRK